MEIHPNIFFFCKKYKIPLEGAIDTEEEIVTPEEIDMLFGNIEQIRDVSKSLLDSLGECGYHGVGKVFVELVSDFSSSS
jgi:hypothetical protein